MKRAIIWALFLLLSASAGFSQVFLWTDKDGVKHYTNTAPPPDAINIKEYGDVRISPLQKELQSEHLKALSCADLFREKVDIFEQKKTIHAEHTSAIVEKINQMPNPSGVILQKIEALQSMLHVLDAKVLVLDAQILRLNCN